MILMSVLYENRTSETDILGLNSANDTQLQIFSINFLDDFGKFLSKRQLSMPLYYIDNRYL